MSKTDKKKIPAHIDADLQGLHEHMTDIGEQAIAFIKTASDLQHRWSPVQFKFVDSADQINGYARKLEAGYEIGIYSQTASVIRNMFDALLAPPEFFPELHETEATTDIQDPVPAAVADAKLAPQPLKLQLASMLTEFCCTFLVFHETAHVVLGHASRSTRCYNRDTIFEYYDPNEILKNDAHIMRASEMDADTLAAQLMAMYIAGFDKVVAEDPEYTEIFRRLQVSDLPEHLTALSLTALSCMFTYLAQLIDAQEKESHHPHPMIRMNHIRSKVVSKVDEQRGIDTEKEFSVFKDYATHFLTSMVLNRILKKENSRSLGRKKRTALSGILIKDADEHRHLYDDDTWIPSDQWG